jgi:hypothetical protein
VEGTAGVLTVPDLAPPVAEPGAFSFGAAALGGAGLPVDLATLEAALARFLNGLGDLGGRLIVVPGAPPLPYWLLALALAGAACELARRQLKQPRAGLVLAAEGDGEPLGWTPDLDDPLPADER